MGKKKGATKKKTKVSKNKKPKASKAKKTEKKKSKSKKDPKHKKGTKKKGTKMKLNCLKSCKCGKLAMLIKKIFLGPFKIIKKLFPRLSGLLKKLLKIPQKLLKRFPALLKNLLKVPIMFLKKLRIKKLLTILKKVLRKLKQSIKKIVKKLVIIPKKFVKNIKPTTKKIVGKIKPAAKNLSRYCGITIKKLFIGVGSLVGLTLIPKCAVAISKAKDATKKVAEKIEEERRAAKEEARIAAEEKDKRAAEEGKKGVPRHKGQKDMGGVSLRRKVSRVSDTDGNEDLQASMYEVEAMIHPQMKAIQATMQPFRPPMQPMQPVQLMQTMQSMQPQLHNATIQPRPGQFLNSEPPFSHPNYPPLHPQVKGEESLHAGPMPIQMTPPMAYPQMKAGLTAMQPMQHVQPMQYMQLQLQNDTNTNEGITNAGPNAGPIPIQMKAGQAAMPPFRPPMQPMQPAQLMQTMQPMQPQSQNTIIQPRPGWFQKSKQSISRLNPPPLQPQVKEELGDESVYAGPIPIQMKAGQATIQPLKPLIQPIQPQLQNTTQSKFNQFQNAKPPFSYPNHNPLQPQVEDELGKESIHTGSIPIKTMSPMTHPQMKAGQVAIQPLRPVMQPMQPQLKNALQSKSSRFLEAKPPFSNPNHNPLQTQVEEKLGEEPIHAGPMPIKMMPPMTLPQMKAGRAAIQPLRPVMQPMQPQLQNTMQSESGQFLNTKPPFSYPNHPPLHPQMEEELGEEPIHAGPIPMQMMPLMTHPQMKAERAPIQPFRPLMQPMQQQPQLQNTTQSKSGPFLNPKPPFSYPNHNPLQPQVEEECNELMPMQMQEPTSIMVARKSVQERLSLFPNLPHANQLSMQPPPPPPPLRPNRLQQEFGIRHKNTESLPQNSWQFDKTQQQPTSVQIMLQNSNQIMRSKSRKMQPPQNPITGTGLRPAYESTMTSVATQTEIPLSVALKIAYGNHR